jgi:hypothetical protein
VGAGRLGFLGQPVLHLQNSFILPFGFCWLNTYCHALGDQLLACLMAWPARLVPADLLGVSHVDKIILLMIINSVSFKFA